MSREEEILGEIEKLDCELSHRRKLKVDWEWLNENRQSLFERYATGVNAEIAFYEKSGILIGSLRPWAPMTEAHPSILGIC